MNLECSNIIEIINDYIYVFQKEVRGSLRYTCVQQK